MSASLWFLSAALALTGPDSDSPGRQAANQFEVRYTEVTLIDERKVAAQEAGLITELTVREGSEIKVGDKIAQINDSKARAAKKVAQAEFEVAEAEATNDISVRYAAKAAEVAQYDYIAHAQANKKAKGSTPEAEMKKLLLQWHKGELETEKAQLELDIAKLTAKAKEAAVESADDDIHRRRVLATLDSMVMEVYAHEGEWVNPGDPIVRVVRMDKVKVEGSLIIDEVLPDQVIDRAVTVEMTLKNKTEQFTGQIVFVAPEVDAGGKYRVIAEVENREKRPGVWWLLKGMRPQMKVDAGIAADKPKKPMR
jgi:multidrug efflux pump subunit AcrA (membrane-fusion protein)